jgi:small subunit ribosomal protein S21
MTTVYVGPREDIEKAIRRFKKKCNTEGIMDELKRREYHEKPSEKKKRKRKLAKKHREEDMYEKDPRPERD